MAVRQGKCINFGNCDIADNKKIIDIKEGEDFVCPECGGKLTAIGKEPIKVNTPMVALVLGGLLLVVLAVVGWFVFQDKKSPASSATPAPNSILLRLHGSNTIGSNLAPELAAAFLIQQGATGVQRVAGKSSEEFSVQGTLPNDRSPKSFEIEAKGSATAFTDLASGSCDIGMASRKIKPEEMQSLSALGDMSSQASESVLALDGIAVIVNRANPITNLTKDQLSKIFSGSLLNWQEVGGSGGTITLYARDDKSGTFDTFKSLVLGKGTLASSAKRFEDSDELSNAVSSDVNAIGFIGLPYIRNAKAVAISEKGASALMPNKFTVATEDYPLSRRLYLYSPETSQNPLVRKFIEFALSKAGQEVVRKVGFIEQTPEENLGVVSSGAPIEYKQATLGAKRLSTNFRFKTGSKDLDNKAVRDLDRVVELLQDLGKQNVLLFGFADNIGNKDQNHILSQRRAEAVAAQFKQRGITPKLVKGFGDELPVASNETEAGREKNRRVEIWLK